MLDHRDPTVPVTLTPDAERVTAACEALVLSYRPPVERDDDDGLRKVLAGLFRSRALDGQVKHGPMEFIREFRNSLRQKRQELMDALWYDCMGEAMFDYLLAETDRLRARVAELEGERDRMRGTIGNLMQTPPREPCNPFSPDAVPMPMPMPARLDPAAELARLQRERDEARLECDRVRTEWEKCECASQRSDPTHQVRPARRGAGGG